MRDIVRDIVRDILALSVSQELRMNLYRCIELSPFFIEFIDGSRRAVALELGANGGNTGRFALGKNMTPVSLLLKPLAYLAEDFILHILIERGNPGTVAAAFLHVDPEILLLGVIQPFTYA